VKRPEPVQGRVVDVLGKPVTEFEVNGRRVRDVEGRFVSDGREDRLDLYARGVGSAVVSHGGQGDAGTIVLGPERVVGVRVLDEVGAPITGAALVRPWPGQQRVSCYSFATNAVDAQGRGWLELQPSQSALVIAPGFLPFETRGGADGDIAEIRLQRGPHTLSGVVLREGKPVRSADLCLSGPTGQLATTGADGTFSFEGLGPGV